MAILKVLLEGRELYSLTLAKGREYSVGRADTCDIVLNKSSVSRQHMKVFFDGQSWQTELTSQYAHFSHLGQNVTQLLLADSQIFVVEGYEFRFIDADKFVEKITDKKDATVPLAPSNFPTEKYNGEAGQNLSPDATTVQPPSSPKHSDNEHTAITTHVVTACLHAYNEETDEEVLFSLDGNHWVAGRSSNCQIRLSETKASRQHFELSRTSTGYEVIDLGSSNGTFLNGKKLQPQARTAVGDGDEIRVGQTVLVFEMRDPRYEEQLAQIPQNLFAEDEADVIEATSEPNPPSFPRNDSIAVIKYEASTMEPEVMADKKKRNFRIAIGAVVALVVLIALAGGNGGNNGQEENPSKGPNDLQVKGPTLKELSPEQKKLAENTYQLAKKFFIEQKYQSAKTELDKLHAMLPFYSDSREMEARLNEAIQTLSELDRIHALQEKQRQTTEDVKRMVQECAGKVNGQTSSEQVRRCLQSAMALDPENKEAQALVEKVGAVEDQRKQNILAKETREGQIHKNQMMFNEAQKTEERKDYLKAIDLYNKLIASGLPDPHNNKAKSRSAIDALNTKITAGITQLLGKAEQFKSQEKYREAYQALAQAMKWDPSDARILQSMNSVEGDLRRKMKALYNDGILEENVGNLEAAKQKWRAIRDQDLDNGEYAKKSTIKLKRYGD